MKELKERANEVIRLYESRIQHFRKMADSKLTIVRRLEEKYDKGEITYERLEKAIKDKCFYDDTLRRTENVLEDIKYILGEER